MHLFSRHACNLKKSQAIPASMQAELPVDGSCIMCCHRWAVSKDHRCRAVSKMNVDLVGVPSIPSYVNEDLASGAALAMKQPGPWVSVFSKPATEPSVKPVLTAELHSHHYLVAPAEDESMGMGA